MKIYNICRWNTSAAAARAILAQPWNGRLMTPTTGRNPRLQFWCCFAFCLLIKSHLVSLFLDQICLNTGGQVGGGVDRDWLGESQFGKGWTPLPSLKLLQCNALCNDSTSLCYISLFSGCCIIAYVATLYMGGGRANCFGFYRGFCWSFSHIFLAKRILHIYPLNGEKSLGLKIFFIPRNRLLLLGG